MRRRILLSLSFLFFYAVLNAQLPDLHVQTNHKSPVNQVVYSYNGKWFASASEDNMIKIWDSETGKIVQTLDNQDHVAKALIFHPRYNILISSSGKNILIWDIINGRVVETLKGHSKEVYCLDFSTGGRYLASGGADETAIVWDYDKRKAKRILKENLMYTNTIYTLKFSRDSRYLFTAGEDIHIKMWNWKKEKIEKRFSMHQYRVNSIDISNNLLASASNDHTVKIFDILEGREIATFRGYKAPAQKVCFHPINEQVIVTYYRNYLDSTAFYKTQRTVGHILLWDINTERVIWRHNEEGGIMDLTLHPDNRSFIASNSSCQIKRYDLTKGDVLEQFGSFTRVNDIALIPEQDELLVAGDDGNLKIWDLDQGKQIRVLDSKINDHITAVSYDPTGKRIAVAYKHIIQLWQQGENNENFVKINTFTVPESVVDKIMFVKNSHNIVISRHFRYNIYAEDLKEFEAYSDGIVPEELKEFRDSSLLEVWNPYRGFLVKTLKASNSPDFVAAMHPESNQLLYANSDNDIMFYDMEEGQHRQLVVNMPEDSSSNIHFMRAMQGNLREAPITNEENKKRHKKNDDEKVYTLCYSNDGRYMAYGGREPVITVWDFEKGLIFEIGRLEDVAKAVAFSPDNQTIATSAGKIVQLWNIKNNDLVYTYHNKYPVNKLQFSGSGNHLITASEDDAIKVWDVRDNKVVGHFISVNKDDYISITKDLFYDASLYGTRGIGLTYNGRSYLIDQFRMRLQRPDKVVQSLEGSQALQRNLYDLYSTKLLRYDFAEENMLPLTYAPRANISGSAKYRSRTKSQHLVMNIRLSDTLYNLDRFNIYVNNVPIYGRKGIDLRPNETDYETRTVKVNLSRGENTVKLSCFNDKGAESLPDSISIYRYAKKSKPDLYFIAFATSAYQNLPVESKHVVNDGRALLSTIADTNKFANIYVDTLFNSQATKDNWLMLKDKLQQSKEDDRIVCFLGGYTMMGSNNNCYFATYDIDAEQATLNGLAYREIDMLMDGIPSRNKMMLMDVQYYNEIVPSNDNNLMAENTYRAVPGIDIDDLIDENTNTSQDNNNATIEDSLIMPEPTGVDSTAVSDELIETTYNEPKPEIVFEEEIVAGYSNNPGQINRLSKETYERLHKLFAELNYASGTATIVISGADRSSIGQHGLLMHHVLIALTTLEADLDDDEEVTANELRVYLRDRLPLTNSQHFTYRTKNLPFKL